MDAIKRFLYSVQWLFIGVVSAYDVYMSVTVRDKLYEAEKNPVGRWLIRLGDGDISLFMGLKVASTVLVLGILVWLYHWRPKTAFAVILGVATFQAWLLYVLHS